MSIFSFYLSNVSMCYASMCRNLPIFFVNFLQAGLEILDVSDPDFAPVNTAASSNDDQDNFNGNHDNNSSWAGLGPDGTCEPWKRSPRKKKLCVTYRFDPNTQACNTQYQ